MLLEGLSTKFLLTLLLVIPLAGCAGCKGGEETGCVSTVDVDGDGWTLCDDCDDDNPMVHPEATDCANGVDDDCDGEVDPAGASEPRTWHPDSDGDGFGDYASTEQACDQPADTVDDATDCDDDEAEVHPEADEYCNERDDDCDGLVDEDAVNMGIWTTDVDGDGWGVDGTEVLSCEQPSGTADQDGDCDDDDPEAHPEAEPGCDGRDLDCDGAIDNDADLDGYSGEACGGKDCDDADDSVYPEAEEVCGDGVVNDCESTTADAIADCSDDLDLVDSLAIIEGGSYHAFAGYSLAGGADLNEDGWSDILVGAPGWGSDTGGQNLGFAGLFYGPLSGNIALSEADASVQGEVGGSWGDQVGQSLALPGDVNADGAEDILLKSDDANGMGVGAAHIFYGPISGALLISEADAEINGASPLGDLGQTMGAGDANGDGYADLIIGNATPYGSTGVGIAFLIHGPVSGQGSVSEADAVMIGTSDGAHAGCAVASAGDVNGDGLDDLLVGAHKHDDAGGSGSDQGMVHLLLSPVSGDLTLDAADASLVGEQSGDKAGAAVAGAGDLDGDGLADFLIGATQEDATHGAAYGKAYAVLGLPSGEVSLSTAEVEFIGAEDGDETGSAVDSAGDVDGDGELDVIIGAPRFYNVSVEAGAAYIVLAPETGSYDLTHPDIRMLGDRDSGYSGTAGSAVAGAGDADGDGRDDVLVGSQTSTGIAGAGIAYLVSIPMTY